MQKALKKAYNFVNTIYFDSSSQHMSVNIQGVIDYFVALWYTWNTREDLDGYVRRI